MSQPVSSKKKKRNSYPMWCVRFWHGMKTGDWFKLLAENRFRVHPCGTGLMGTVTCVSPVNSIGSRVQTWRYGKRIAATELRDPPVFIVGHWRSGTTFLHELMVNDDRFDSPNTYQCFVPHHFLLSEWLVTRYLGFLMPKQRPMDNMAVGFLRPHEDEFALMNMGLPSPYKRMAFPNNPPPDLKYLNMEGLSQQELEAWKAGMHLFLKTLTFKNGKRLILKSPTHTGRVGVLAEMFPNSKFIHIARDPFDVYASTHHLWPALEGVQCFQSPRYDERLDEFIFDCQDRMYRGYFSQRETIPSNRLCEVRYEDVVRDPVGQLQQIYSHLDLGDFEYARPAVEAFVASQKDYRKNDHQLDPALRDRIRERWAKYFENFGYAEESTAGEPSSV
ncbi:MAG: sulfotransferase [Pirellulaceae bacterium]